MREQSGGNQSPNVKQRGEPGSCDFEPKHKITAHKVAPNLVRWLPVAEDHPEIHHPQTHKEMPADPTPSLLILFDWVHLMRYRFDLGCIFYYLLVIWLESFVFMLAEPSPNGAVGRQGKQDQTHCNLNGISQRHEAYLACVSVIFLTSEGKIRDQQTDQRCCKEAVLAVEA